MGETTLARPIGGPARRSSTRLRAPATQRLSQESAATREALALGQPAPPTARCPARVGERRSRPPLPAASGAEAGVSERGAGQGRRTASLASHMLWVYIASGALALTLIAVFVFSSKSQGSKTDNKQTGVSAGNVDNPPEAPKQSQEYARLGKKKFHDGDTRGAMADFRKAREAAEAEGDSHAAQDYSMLYNSAFRSTKLDVNEEVNSSSKRPGD